MLLYELLQQFNTPVGAADARREKVAAVMARSATRGAKASFAREEVQALLDRLTACGNPSFTPSGKRIMPSSRPKIFARGSGDFADNLLPLHAGPARR